MSVEGSRKAIIAAFAANLGIAVAKFTAFLFSGATSLLVEAIHSLADTTNQGLLLLGGRRASRAPDDEHPFGHSRERYFWAFIVALVIFSVGGLFAVYEGIEKLLHPTKLADPAVAFGVLGFSIVLEFLSLRTGLREARHERTRGQSLWRFVRDSKVPELPVVLLEDLGALAGLALALAGLIAAEATGNARFDAAGSIAIGLLLIGIASVLSTETKSLLIGEAAAGEVITAITGAITDAPNVRSLIHLRTLQLGPTDLLVTAKVELDGTLAYAEVARAIDAIEVRIRTVAPTARLIFLEPDVRVS